MDETRAIPVVPPVGVALHRGPVAAHVAVAELEHGLLRRIGGHLFSSQGLCSRAEISLSKERKKQAETEKNRKSNRITK